MPARNWLALTVVLAIVDHFTDIGGDMLSYGVLALFVCWIAVVIYENGVDTVADGIRKSNRK